MDGPDDATRQQALYEDAGRTAQIIHLQKSCTFLVRNETKKFQCNLTGDGKLIMVTNGAGKCWWGCPDASRVVPIEGSVSKNQMGAFIRSVCIRMETMHTRVVGFPILSRSAEQKLLPP